LNRLVKYELAKQLKDKRYTFIDYVDGQEEVIKAVGRWRRVAGRYPTVDEVAAEAGMVPEETKRLVYGTKAKTGWFPPTPEIVEEVLKNSQPIKRCHCTIILVKCLCQIN